MDELYRQYSQIVFHFLYTKCHNPALAEDLMQETFLKAIESIDTFTGDCKMSTWLCQIAKHLLYQHWHKSSRIVLEEVDDTLESERNTEQEVIAKIELTDVWDKLQTFPADMRKVVELRVLGDLSFREIGSMLGKSENWARVTFHRAKVRLIKEVSYGKDEL